MQNNDSSQLYLNQVLPKLESDIQKFKTKNIWNIDRLAVEGLFVDRPFIADFLVTKHWPNQLEVTLKMSKVILWMENNRGIRPLFDNQKWGQYIKSTDQNFTPRWWIEHEESENNRLKIYDVTQALLKNKKLNIQNIEKIMFTDTNNIKLSLKSKQTDILLTEADFTSQVERVTQVLEYLDRYQIEARVIDSQYTKKVLVRLRTRP